MSNFSKQENRLKLSRIDYVIIICYSVITFLSFILDNPIVYLFLGLVMLGVYLYKITKAPANVLSLSLLAGHPFNNCFKYFCLSYIFYERWSSETIYK